MSQSPVSLETTEDTNNLFGSGDLTEFGPKFKLKTFPRIHPQTPERPPEHDFSQQMSMLQAQMSMLSQLALTRQAGPPPPQNDSVAAILAFQLGEKLGTIGTNGESTKTSLSSALQSVDALSKQSTDLRHELDKTKLELQHMDRGTTQLSNRVDTLTASITEYGQTLAGLRTELSHASESRHQDRSEASERIRGLTDDLKATQQRILELEVANSRMTDELRSLSAAQREERKELSVLTKSHHELSKQIRLAEANSVHDRDSTAKALERAAKDLRELQRLMGAELRSMEEKQQANAAAVQALRFEVQSDRQRGPSLADGALGLLLRAFLPFVPKDRLQNLLSFLSARVSALVHPLARRLSLVLLALDLVHRLLSYHIPEVTDFLAAALRLNECSLFTRLLFRLCRLCFEVAMPVQILLLLHDRLSKRVEAAQSTLKENRRAVVSTVTLTGLLAAAVLVARSNRPVLKAVNRKVLKQVLLSKRLVQRQSRATAKEAGRLLASTTSNLSAGLSSLANQLPSWKA